MMHDIDEQDTPAYSGKLVLPATTDAEIETDIAMINTDEHQHVGRVRSEQLMLHDFVPPPPKYPWERLRYFWHKDPAYKVLLIAVTCVLLAGLALSTLATRTFLQNANFLSRGTTHSQTAPPHVTPSGTVDLKPTFAPPSGGQGSTASSQPPQSNPVTQNNPVTQPTTPPVQPGPTQPASQLSVQITSVPSIVQNNSIVFVGVNTSEPFVEVQLSIVYNAPPYRGFVGSRFTGVRGNTNFTWPVTVFLGGRNAVAVITVTAKDQNGQSVQSSPATVEIIGKGLG